MSDRQDQGASVSQTGLSSPTEPSGLGPTGFDPSRIVKSLRSIEQALEVAWAAVDELADDAGIEGEECEAPDAGYGPLCALGTGNTCWCDRAGCIAYKVKRIREARELIAEMIAAAGEPA